MIIGAQKKHSNLPARTIKLCRTHRNYVCNECKYMREDSRECNGRRMVLFVRHPIRRDIVDVYNRTVTGRVSLERNSTDSTVGRRTGSKNRRTRKEKMLHLCSVWSLWRVREEKET